MCRCKCKWTLCTMELQMNWSALVLQSVHHLAAVAACIIPLELSHHKCSISREILSELHATPDRNTTSSCELMLDKVMQPLISQKNDHKFIICPFSNLNSPKPRLWEPIATSTSVSWCPPAAGSQDHLTRTSLGELSSGSYQNLHGRVVLPPLTANTDDWADSTWSFTPLKWTVGNVDITLITWTNRTHIAPICIKKIWPQARYIFIDHVHTFFVAILIEELVVEEVVRACGGSRGPAWENQLSPQQQQSVEVINHHHHHRHPGWPLSNPQACGEKSD